MTVWIYTQGETVRAFASDDAARAWFELNDPEGVAFEHEVIDMDSVTKEPAKA